jgi:hypothetical protein
VQLGYASSAISAASRSRADEIGAIAAESTGQSDERHGIDNIFPSPILDPNGIGKTHPLSLSEYVNRINLIAGDPLPGTGAAGPEVALFRQLIDIETDLPSGAPYCLPQFEAAARSLKVEPIAAPVHNDNEIEILITSLGREPGGGLVVSGDVFTYSHRAPIILLAARNNIPAVYQQSVCVRDGGLLSYGADYRDIFRRSASYVDRVLRGEKPAELPVQVPTKSEMVVNLKTAKSLGLTVPQSILLTADEVIE